MNYFLFTKSIILDSRLKTRTKKLHSMSRPCFCKCRLLREASWQLKPTREQLLFFLFSFLNKLGCTGNNTQKAHRASFPIKKKEKKSSCSLIGWQLQLLLEGNCLSNSFFFCVCKLLFHLNNTVLDFSWVIEVFIDVLAYFVNHL